MILYTGLQSGWPKATLVAPEAGELAHRSGKGSIAPYCKRPRVEPTQDWSQLQLRLASPEQVNYELIRPVVLFGWSPAERAKQTDLPERTLRRKADRFDAEGMASLFRTTEPQAPRALPPAVRRASAPGGGICAMSGRG